MMFDDENNLGLLHFPLILIPRETCSSFRSNYPSSIFLLLLPSLFHVLHFFLSSLHDRTTPLLFGSGDEKGKVIPGLYPWASKRRDFWFSR